MGITNADAGVTADDRAAERMPNPSSAADIFFIIEPPFQTTEVWLLSNSIIWSDNLNSA